MIYSDVIAQLQKNDSLLDWEDLQKTAVSIINEKPRAIRLPGVIAGCYQSVSDRVVAVSTSLAVAFSGIVLLDDVLDGDFRFGKPGPEIANMSAGLFALMNEIVVGASQDPQMILMGQAILNRLVFNVSLGQSLDVQNPETEEGYWQVAALKSGAFFEGVFQLGGLAGGAARGDLQVLGELGREYGLLLQIHDDLRDVLETPANSDWVNGRFSLPILFAHLVEHPERERFETIRTQVQDPELLAEAQAILLRCGAISYGLYQIEEHYQVVPPLLSQLTAREVTPIDDLFRELVEPVQSMVESLNPAG